MPVPLTVLSIISNVDRPRTVVRRFAYRTLCFSPAFAGVHQGTIPRPRGIMYPGGMNQLGVPAGHRKVLRHEIAQPTFAVIAIVCLFSHTYTVAVYIMPNDAGVAPTNRAGADPARQGEDVVLARAAVTGRTKEQVASGIY